MTVHRAPALASRRKPRQARSVHLVSAILEAALQVLAQEGAQRFTTTRVAERAGVSVGSVYQYFPNKASILFRLQADEWKRTSELLCGLLAEGAGTPLERLRALVHAFVRRFRLFDAVGVALADAAPLYRDAPEARQAHAASERAFDAFMREALPRADDAARTVAGDLVIATLSQVGKEFSETPRTAQEIETYAQAMADMFCAYLRSLGRR